MSYISQLCLPLQQKSPDLLQTQDDPEPLLRLFVLFQKIFRTLDGVLFLPQEMIDEMQILDIDRPEIPVPFLILARLQDIELRLPEPEQTLVNAEHFRYLSHGIVLLAE